MDFIELKTGLAIFRNFFLIPLRIIATCEKNNDGYFAEILSFVERLLSYSQIEKDQN